MDLKCEKRFKHVFSSEEIEKTPSLADMVDPEFNHTAVKSNLFFKVKAMVASI